jgi:surface antigen
LPAATVQFPVIVVLGALAPMMPGAAQVPSSILCTGYAACAAGGHSNYGYATAGGRSYWAMSAGDECTNYVAYVESAEFLAPAPRFGLGNAGQWASAAASHGVTVNNVPAVGAVAEWDAGSFGIGGEGHVAVVQKVGPRDTYIVISQQHNSSDVNGYDWTRINAGFPSDSWQSWPSHFIHFPVRGSASVGYYNTRTGTVSVREMLGAAAASLSFKVTRPGVIPLAGAWPEAPAGGGYYDPRNAMFRLRNGLASGKARPPFRFGPPGMIPLVGDWTGKGGDRIGYYDPRDGTFHLRDYLSAGPAQYTFAFGPPGMIPLVGDWTGKGSDGVGYYNPRTARFYLRQTLSAGPASSAFAFGPRGMVPLAGNWTGGAKSEIGFYNPRSGWFHLRDGLSRGPVRFAFAFGPREMTPLAADWLG